MRKNKVFILLICLLLVACSHSKGIEIEQLKTMDQLTEEQIDSKEPQKQIALVMKTLTNPFYIQMEQGARKAEKELGIKLIVRAGAKETSIDQQISIVEELIQKKVDAIVISPGGSELIPVLKEAQDAGIVIVNIDNRLDPKISKKWGLENVIFISVDNKKSAYLSAKFISKKISQPTKAVILEGIQGTINSEDRKSGAVRAFRENSYITIEAIETANWKIDEAYMTAKDLYKKHPDIGAFFCANDMMALGVIRYLKESKKEDVLVAGYDALDEAKKAIKEGWLLATVDQHADLQGYLGVKYANKMIEQWQPETDEILIETDLVYSENLK